MGPKWPLKSSLFFFSLVTSGLHSSISDHLYEIPVWDDVMFSFDPWGIHYISWRSHCECRLWERAQGWLEPIQARHLLMTWSCFHKLSSGCFCRGIFKAQCLPVLWIFVNVKPWFKSVEWFCLCCCVSKMLTSLHLCRTSCLATCSGSLRTVTAGRNCGWSSPTSVCSSIRHTRYRLTLQHNFLQKSKRVHSKLNQE